LASGKDVSKIKIPYVYIGGSRVYKCPRPQCEFLALTKEDIINHIRAGLHNFRKPEQVKTEKPRKRKERAKIYQF